VKLAVLGDPLRYTASPLLHRAGLAALGFEGDSAALRTPLDDLSTRLHALAAAGYRGVNLTIPLKAAVLPLLDRISAASKIAHSVNTVGFESGSSWGETTDGPGFLDFLERIGVPAAGRRVVLLGAGGASRSIAASLIASGAASLDVGTRDPASHAPAWRGLGIVPRAWTPASPRKLLDGATLVINATPLSAPDAPVPPGDMPREALAIDLGYGEEVSPWVVSLRAAGFAAEDGLGMLIHQARRSLGLWTGCPVPLEPLEAAVGWPR